MTESAAGRPRHLAFVYHPESFPLLELIAAGRKVGKLIWIVNSGVGQTSDVIPLLRRAGAVVDVAGATLDETIAAISALGPDGILTLKDSLQPWTATVAAALGLPFHTPAVAWRLTDKLAQRQALRAGGLPTPGSWRLRAGDDASVAAAIAAAPWPCVIKPRRLSEGSRDTVRVDGPSDLEACMALTGSEEFVLEEYLADRPPRPGRPFADYVSVESVVSHGRIEHVAVTGRFPPAEPFRESGFFIEADLDAADRAAALQTATAALTALGITTGCPHTEIKFTPDGPRVIEVNGRIGGGVPEMLGDLTGGDLLADAMRIALGDDVSAAKLPPAHPVGFLFYVHAPRDMIRITAVDGLDDLASDPAVREVIVRLQPGETVDWRVGNHGHVFSVRGVVPDHDALARMYERVLATVRISGDRTDLVDLQEVDDELCEV